MTAGRALDLAAAEARIAAATWGVLPGRKAAHAMVGTSNLRGACAQTKAYPERQITPAGKERRRCEQCLIALVCGASTASWKFMVGHVPPEVRRERRAAWRAYRAHAM